MSSVERVQAQTNLQMERPVPLAIIGMGCLFPKADQTGTFWANIKNGVDGITPIPDTHWNPDDYFDADPKSPDRTYAKTGGFLDSYDFSPLEFGIAPKDLEATDSAQLLGLVATQQALKDAGYGPERPFDRNRISVILGVTGTQELVIPLGARLGHPRWRKALHEAGVDPETSEDVVQRIADSYVPWQENSFPGLLGNVVAGRIANRLDLGGTNCVVDAACASSLSAIHLAGMELALGRSDLAVTGGVDTFNDIFMYMCFSKTPALSPTGHSKPFDSTGDGTILGEGLGIVVLKRLADAERDGDRIYAVIRSIGSSSDGKGAAIYAPVAAGQKKALKTAYALAGVSPDTIELVEAHGTGTKVGDTVEVHALTEVYREAQAEGTWCAIGSVKSQIGHTKSTAGAAGLIKAALALYHKVLPPTIKVQEPIEALKPGQSPFYVNTEKRPWLPSTNHPRRAAVSAFGFGGSNFHAVLEEASTNKPAIDWDGDVQMVALSGANRAEIEQQLSSWPNQASWKEYAHRATTSRKTFQAKAPCRLTFVLHKQADSVAKVLTAARNLVPDAQENAFAHSPDGIFFGQGAVEGSLAVLFPGQGSQYVGMFRDWACTFPEFQATLAEANAVFSEQERLSDFIYPHPAFRKETRAEQEGQLRRTQVAQPALGAIDLAAWKVLQSFGVTASAFAGHSYGELVALCAGGVYDSLALHELSRLRGELMDRQRAGDPGSMLAVHAPQDQIESVLKEEKIDLVIANKNSPKQIVLSGATDYIEQAHQAFQKRKIRTSKLLVAAGFHSPFVADAEKPFREVLDSIPIQPAKLPVFANSTSQPYPNDPNTIRTILSQQLAQPVAFVAQIEKMVHSGIRTFVEVGPGSVLSRLVDAIVQEEKNRSGITCFTIATDSSGGKRPGLVDLALLLARLSAQGFALQIENWDPETYSKPVAPTGKATLTVPINGANYVKTRPSRPPREPKRSLPSTSQPVAATSNSSVPIGVSRQRVVMNESSSHPNPPVQSTSSLNEALQVTQQSLLAFQKLQEETAQLHRQFLEHQEAAQRTLQLLVQQQQTLLAGGMGLPTVPLPSVPVVQPPVRTPPVVAQPMVQPVVPPTPTVVAQTVPTPTQQVEPPSRVSTAVPPPAKTVAVSPTNVEQTLLSVIAEKTGYPVEMLNLDMTMDSDLGIDSIKRVEILSTLQERLPDAPIVKPEHLGVLHSLRDVAEFLGKRSNPTPITNPVPVPSSNGAKPHATPAKIPTATLYPEHVQKTLLSVISEKTGYPVEMLNLDMTMDADLGIDSIKRVEILSAIQERLPDAPIVKPEHLGTLHNLQDIVHFLSQTKEGSGTKYEEVSPLPLADERMDAGAPFAQQEPEESPALEAHGSISDMPSTAVGSVADYHELLQQSLVRLDRSILRTIPLDLSQPRKPVTLPKGSVIWLIAEPSSLTAKLAQQLDALEYRPQFIPWNDSPYAYDPKSLGGLILFAPEGPAPQDIAARGFRWVKRASAGLHNAAKEGGALIAAILRMDGHFGLQKMAADLEPYAAGLAGIVKTASHEWPQISCKVIDLDPGYARVHPHVIVEELTSKGPIEVGIAMEGRFQLQTAASPLGNEKTRLLFSSKDVIVISGGARGVTAETAITLACTSQPTLILLGRTPPPETEPAWLAPLQEESAMKKAIAENALPHGSPKEVGDYYKRIISQRDIRQTLEQIQKAGSKVQYYSVDIQDSAATMQILNEVRHQHGPIRGLIHGAGVLADRRIEDLTDQQFDHVYGTKVIGMQNLLAATMHDPLKGMVFFSSSTGRFGRTGQSAYAAANEVLNKFAQQQARLRPDCRVVSINWGPWSGGMVSPALAKMFTAEGIGLIPLKEGSEYLLQELSARDRATEVVLVAYPDDASAPPVQVSAPLSAIAKETAPAFERTINLEDHPILRSHVMDGKAVLPMALHMEWLAHAALHGNPGFQFIGFNELRILQGVLVTEKEPAQLKVVAGRTSKEEGYYIVPVELRGRKAGREAIHSRAEIVLGFQFPKPPDPLQMPKLDRYPHPFEEIYKYYLFHGPALQGIQGVEGVADQAFVGLCRTAPPPNQWLKQPLRSHWLADPLVLDSSFQMMILWSYLQHGAGSLPCYAGQYRQFVKSFPTCPIYVQIRVTKDSGTLARADMDFLDDSGRLLARIIDYECVIDPSLNHAFRKNQLIKSLVK